MIFVDLGYAAVLGPGTSTHTHTHLTPKRTEEQDISLGKSFKTNIFRLANAFFSLHILLLIKGPVAQFSSFKSR